MTSLRNIRIIGLSVSAFLMMLSYSFSRPAVESLFLAAHSKDELPYVWILVAIGATLSVLIYTRYVKKNDLIHLYGVSSLYSALLLVFLLLAEHYKVPGVYYALYVWKDVYIIVIIEIYYSYSNAVFSIKTAKLMYGIFGVVGAIGSIVGNLSVGVLAKRYSTHTTLWIVPLFLVLLWLLCFPFRKVAGIRSFREESEEGPKKKPKEYFSFTKSAGVVRTSSYLFFVLLLVVLTQIVITLVDFEFKTSIKYHFPMTDPRTAVIGQVYAIIAFGTFFLHALTAPILYRYAIPATLLTIPFILLAGTASLILVPSLAIIIFVKIASKSFDYTIFRSAKEMLYIPLTYEEKTAGKSIVDMWIYRLAKGGASLFLLTLIMLKLVAWVPELILFMCLLWLFVTIVIVKRFRQKVSLEEERIGLVGGDDEAK